MDLGQKHLHPETHDKQHTRLLWVNTPKKYKILEKGASIWIQKQYYFTFCIMLEINNVKFTGVKKKTAV